MSGVVAAGQRDTAEAAAAVLRDGGNAVDAAIAGATAAFVAEPLLASAGGAGLMTVALPGARPAVVDFFSDVPGKGAPARADALDFDAVEVDFGTVTQTFHVGRGSAAFPGALPGLALAHERWGSLPLADLVAPARALASGGVVVTAETAHVFDILWPILSRDPETVRVVCGGGKPRAGDRLVNPELDALLGELARTATTPARFTDALVAGFGPARGGLITRADVEAFAPRVVEPVTVDVGEWTVCTSPAVGGQLVAHILEALVASGGAELVDLARASRGASEHRGVLIAPGASVPGSTTHISVVDTGGGAAAVTLTNGEGSGHLVPGTGVQVNNFLGEEDLNPHGFHSHSPGDRLPTMCAPTVALRDGMPALAVGSGGANRIRSSVGGVLARVLLAGQGLEDAVRAPRVHAEGGDVWIELGDVAGPERVTAALQREFERVHAFDGPDFFFGGVHAVEIDERGRPVGVGDRRRGGVAIAVP